jgi:hypothetical protein
MGFKAELLDLADDPFDLFSGGTLRHDHYHTHTSTLGNEMADVPLMSTGFFGKDQ